MTPGLLGLRLALVVLALGLQALVAGGGTGRLLGLALRVGRLVLGLVVESHVVLLPYGRSCLGPLFRTRPQARHAVSPRHRESLGEGEDAVLERSPADRPPVVQVALPQPPRLAIALVGQLV